MRPVTDAGQSDSPDPKPLAELDDSTLVKRAAGGEEAAFEELVRRFGGLVLGLARRKVGREDADDVAQDALLHVWRSLPSLREPQAFIGWLSRLVQNRANRWIHQRSRKLVVLQQARNELLTRAEARSENSSQLETHELVSQLPDEMRLALIWKYVEGLSYDEIGERLSMSFHQVDYLMRRARATLRKQLERSDDTKGENA
ncbi:MAG: sigma-70 family RNA polymerase sigma factor [Planctomycetota bacterium]|nr:sigma-70 family RNA polymerase sigma factor [Planctomycetota bacterium]